MLQLKNLLVPLDFSEKNGTAVDIALDLARANKAHITLLHVIENIDLQGDNEVDSFELQLQERATRNLEKIAHKLQAAGATVDFVTRFGKRAREIALYQKDHGIDLIVMSSHPIDAEDPARSLATLSYQVAVLASCHVMLVK
ncbi:MAG: universal stress protein [Pseudomonadales bacterium]|nr:universal stress protein [Pseudomonadales bacterium]